jgi:predicted alpha-1,2-mannosidase
MVGPFKAALKRSDVFEKFASATCTLKKGTLGTSLANPPVRSFASEASSMRRFIFTLILALLVESVALCIPLMADTTDGGATPANAVDVFIGTNPNPFTKAGYSFDTGNVYPGAICPRGLVAWSPDTTHHKQIAGGYWYPDSKIEDFSLTHFSGRGVPCLKDIAFLPVMESVDVSPGKDWSSFAATFSHAHESASTGYYRVKFDNGIETELTATFRTGMARFKFPQQPLSTLMIRTDGAVTVEGNDVSGNSTWRDGKPKVYFFAQFSQPIKSVQTWDAQKLSNEKSAAGKSCGAVLTLDTSADSTVQVRVGISYTSLANAMENLKAENTGWDFSAIQKKAVEMWNHELGRIEITGGTADQQKVFYTALYHCCIHPNYLEDVNGQYIGMDQKVHKVLPGHHQYQNIPAWDEHRSHVQLMAILTPDQSSDVMQSLVNYAEQDASVRPEGGGLPRWEQVNINSGGMVGDGDDSIIASAYAFGATHFDTQAALAAMEKGASKPGTTSDGHKVRDGSAEYKARGYVPDEAAVTLEYNSDDFALSRFAAALGEPEAAETFLRQAQGWKNLFDKTIGYIRPRNKNGDWLSPFVSASGKGYVEGTGAQYLWLVNFNYKTLIEDLGGNEAAVKRLDTFFTKTNDGLKTEYAYMGNEPCEETPWVYDFAAAPWRTQEVVRRIQTELFTTQPSGLPGNDDAGSLSSWYVFSALGLYPEIPGVAGFTVGSPIFPKAAIHLENGRTIEISGQNASATTPYVQTLLVNGKPYESPWIPWNLLSEGGTLSFALGDKPSKWGSDPTKAPPSFDADPVH